MILCERQINSRQVLKLRQSKHKLTEVENFQHVASIACSVKLSWLVLGRRLWKSQKDGKAKNILKKAVAKTIPYCCQENCVWRFQKWAQFKALTYFITTALSCFLFGIRKEVNFEIFIHIVYLILLSAAALDCSSGILQLALNSVSTRSRNCCID